MYLYTKDTRHITYNEFINRELILFSNMDNVRSIPCLMDGLKPGQRKVMFTCIKRNLTQKEIKVAQLAGSVAEQSAYHHGEVSWILCTAWSVGLVDGGTTSKQHALPAEELNSQPTIMAR